VSYADLTREYMHALPSIEMQPFETTSALDALEAIQRGDADLGFSTADIAYLAFAGHLDPQHPRLDRLRAIFASGVLPLHLIAMSSSGISSVADLRGKEVGIGTPGSSIERASKSTLAAFGLGIDTIQARSLPSMLAVEELREGKIEAMFVFGAYPGAPAEPARAALTSGGRLVPIQGPVADRLRESNRFLVPAIIPAGTYEDQLNPITTVGVQDLLICRRDLDEVLVYDLTKGFFAAVPRSTTLVESFRLMDLGQAVATSVPLHDGAARYYRERDLFQ
jgi:TRAP transporter TAXI family solute receptor